MLSPRSERNARGRPPCQRAEGLQQHRWDSQEQGYSLTSCSDRTNPYFPSTFLQPVHSSPATDHGYAGCTQANKVNALSQGRTHSASAFVVILRRKILFSSTVFGLHPQPRQLQTGCTSHRLPKAPDPRAAVPEASWLWPCAAGGAEPAPPSALPNAPGCCRTSHNSCFCNGKEKPRGWVYPLPAPVAARLVTALWKGMEMEI